MYVISHLIVFQQTRYAQDCFTYLLWDGVLKECHQRYSHMKMLIFLGDIISDFTFTCSGTLWFSGQEAMQDLQQTRLKDFGIGTLTDKLWGPYPRRLSCTAFICPAHRPWFHWWLEKFESHRDAGEKVVKGQMNFAFNYAQCERLSVNGSKDFSSSELIFQCSNYWHEAIRQNLDLIFFKMRLSFITLLLSLNRERNSSDYIQWTSSSNNPLL